MATSSKTAKPAVKGAEPAEAPKKSKKLLIISIIAGVLLLMIAGAAGAYFLLKKAPDANHTAAAAGTEPSKVPVFVNIEPYVVNLQQEDGDHFLQVSITLQVNDDGTAEAIKTFMPLVRSRLLIALSSKKASELLTVDGKKKLTEEIITSLNQPFTPNSKPQQVSDVFFTSFVIQQQ
ncbi:MAG: flagellar basal body protein FliL [Herbaspirillum sp.]|jgi:flagellar FliL protein|nr:flagellar basal body protein FliL [Herbaspirillum sp.]